jgi:hypothetical protein
MTNREIAALCAKEVWSAKREAEMTTIPFTLRSAGEIIESVLNRVGFTAKPAPKKSAAKMADDEWIASLEKEPALRGVDIRREIGKAQFWAKNHRRQATRAFIVNWLMKADRTLTVEMNGQTSRATVSPDPYKEPPNWRPVAAQLYPDTDYFTGRDWLDVSLDYRKAIVNQMFST